MFALEINFRDGVSQPEMLLVRRPQAILGSSDYAHVVIEGSGGLAYELRLSRGIGRKFSCQKFGKAGSQTMSQMLSEGEYDGEAEIDLGDVSTTISSLDTDLLLRQGESPDLAGVRVLRRALAVSSPEYPAVVIAGPSPVFVSFHDDQPLLIGRSRKCGLRLDASDVSSEHARIGVEDGKFWIEDLGSTNGTFVKGERVVGRQVLANGEAVEIGSEYKVFPVATEIEVAQFTSKIKEMTVAVAPPATHPCLVAGSEDVTPPRFIIAPNSRILIGRDPASDIWTGLSHISGRHAEIESDADGKIFITDFSRNGTSIDGQRLEREQRTRLTSGITKIDLGAGLSCTLYLSKDDEEGGVGRDRQSLSSMVRSLEKADRERRPVHTGFDTMSVPAPSLSPEQVVQGSNGGGVFEQLARRAAQKGAVDEEGGIFPPTESTSPRAPSAGTGILDDLPTPVSRVGRILLGLAILVLSVVLLLLVGWFLGSSSG